MPEMRSMSKMIDELVDVEWLRLNGNRRKTNLRTVFPEPAIQMKVHIS
jgi:hypothetical protein